MLKLGGATTAAMRYARVWECPVCKEMQAPEIPQEASSAKRPFGSNVPVSIDLKYMKDKGGK